MNTMLRMSALLLVTALLLSCRTGPKTTHFMHENLTKLWETEPRLTTSESVCFNPAENLLYVSCINGQPLEKNGQGFIAKVDPDGNIVDLKWIEGLDAPKGMGIFEGKLYVTDIDQLVEIDIADGAIVNRFPAEGAQFLNDISIDAAGNVYVSDMTTNKIHRLSAGNFEVWLESEMLDTPNGLFVENDFLLIGMAGSVLKAGLQDAALSVYIENTGGIDGLEADGNGNYIISDWTGNVHLIHPGKEKIKLLDTTPVKQNAADIEFIIEKNMLLVPTFFDNRVTAYEVKDFQ